MATKTALVLEGGGMRGMFTAGVLDVFLERGLTGFSHVYGVSAGAINAANFLAGQTGRFCRDVLAFRDNPNFMGMWSYLKTGNVSGREFLYHKVNNDLDPFDYASFNANPVPFTAVATDVTFGTAAYLRVDRLPEQMDAVVASSSLPCLSEVVDYEGERLLDGGTADSVPVELALSEGADHVVTVLTRARDYVKGDYALMGVARQRYAEFPYYLEALESRSKRYNEQRQRIWNLEAQGALTVVAPPRPVEMGVMASDGERLLELYMDGRRMAMSVLDEVRALLGA